MEQYLTWQKLRLPLALLILLLTVESRAGDGDQQSGSGTGGRTIFLAQKCNMCHSVQSAGIEATTKSKKMKGPDLTGITSRRETDWIAKYIRKEVQLDGRDHKKEFKGSEKELAAVISWLGEQTPESTGE